MKLLIVAQVVDTRDSFLSFFHGWIEEISKRFEKTTVICLKKGYYNLPGTEVLSLGKETMPSRLGYIIRFYQYAWKYRKEYDAVFVHMNQEYVLLGGLLWKLLGKKVYMWRNHHAGSFLTDMAALWCAKVFCTSKFSYTARYRKTVLMPLGTDTTLYRINPSVHRKKDSILFLGRISPVKKPDLLLGALYEISQKHSEVTATFVGDFLEKDRGYYESLLAKTKEFGLEEKVVFKKGVPSVDTLSIYNVHDVFVNLSSNGMYDKTIFEAMACGCLVLASNDNLKGLIGDDFIFAQDNKGELIQKLEILLRCDPAQREKAVKELREVAAKNSLQELAHRLAQEMMY